MALAARGTGTGVPLDPVLPSSPEPDHAEAPSTAFSSSPGPIQQQLPHQLEPGLPERKALRRMYQSGEWSDLTIMTSTKTFKVHKAVVCPASAFFLAACTRGFQETQTGQITVAEDEHTMDAILKSFYELPVEWLCTERAIIDELELGTRRDWLERIMALRKAIDKYNLNALARSVQMAFLWQYSPELPLKDIVEVGAMLFHDEMPLDTHMGLSVKFRVPQHIPNIHKDRMLWGIVVKYQDFLEFVMDALVEEVQFSRKRKRET